MKRMIGFLVSISLVLAACTTGGVEPTTTVVEEPAQETADQFCQEIKRSEPDFSVLNDLRTALKLYSIFRDTAGDSELILNETLNSMFSYLGVYSTNIPQWARDIVDKEIARAQAANSEPDFSVLSQVYDELVKDPAYSDLKDPSRLEEFIEVLINGAIEALGDPFANYVRADYWKAGYANYSGQFEGFGFSYDFNDKSEIVIQSVVKGSPMERAGIKTGDFFVKVDGKSLENCTRELFSMTLRGYEKDNVKFDVERAKPGTFEREAFAVEVRREAIKNMDVITYPGVDLPNNRGNTADELKYRCGNSAAIGSPCPFDNEDGEPVILYIQIKAFNPIQADDLEYVLNNIDQSKFEGVVLDMRDNGGGSVVSWIKTANMLMSTDGYIRTTKTTNRGWGVLGGHYGSSGGKVTTSFEEDGIVVARLQGKNEAILRQDLPMTILLNKDSYSASEASAAALRGNGRAVIVSRDERSGGKGTTNIHLELRRGDYGAVYVSIAFFLTPDGEMIEKQDLDKDGHYEVGGLKPDIHVPWSNEDFRKNGRDVNYDPTLNTSLEYIREQLSK